jgi:uncharacterized protein (TIGR02268 family)
MFKVLLPGAALFAVLLASAALAQDVEPRVRNLYLSDDPRDAAPRVNVGGRVATVLRFEQDVDPAGTKMLGWEGWFEPVLVGGRSVVLVPLQKIPSDDRFLLKVALADGTELPFTVTARESGWVDQQVNVFPDRESAAAVRSRLADADRRERVLQEENERYRKEEISVDHALAALLVSGAVELTPFEAKRRWRLPCDGIELQVRHLATREGDKEALVFHVKNQDPDVPWELMEARLIRASTGAEWPFAIRTDRAQIAPGTTGTIAVVADLSTFDFKEGAEKLVLQLFRADGLMVASVTLEKVPERK